MIKPVFVRFTNNADGHKGMPLHINVNMIASVYEFPSVEGGSLQTCVYGGPSGSVWVVEESVSEVLKKISEVTRDI